MLNTRKYAVGIWNDDSNKYEIHHKTDIYNYAKTQRDYAIKNGLKAIILIYNEN